MRAKDGAWKWILSRGRALLRGQDGLALRLIGTHVDITERKLAEANLLRTTALLRAIGENSLDPIYAKDTNGRFLYANPAALAVIGKSADSVLGHTDADFHSNPEQTARVMENDRRIIQCGMPEVLEETWDTPDQGTRIYRSAKAPLSLDDGPPIGIVCVSSDITDMKAAKAEAERANEAKSHFLAAASHDLCQPFQVMRLSYDLLDLKVTDAGQRRMLNQLGSAMNAAEAFVNELLDIAKLDSGGVKVKRALVAPDRIIRDLVNELAPVAANKGLDLRAFTCGGGLINTDLFLLRRVLRNLLTNAIRYTETGGVLVGMRRRSGSMTFEVWDTGVGIAPEFQELVFEEFYQVPNKERGRSNGSGLGLANVRRMCGLLKCEASLASRPGRGSVFRVRVPLGAPPGGGGAVS